ncbi:hypothetical protein NE686_17895 [Tissierella carlieri]|uniref:Uncharacterized protein n=1 Tax=Tissierella carlieri TaxID=689904 RepID=A0ABT1SEQ7_9FIRM|nr:hypothetical protein [Tissierella carlieri]MCQ4924978.1 hypothetical protein [Tissierella carlieri]
MNKLDALIDKFETDEGWNSLERGGGRRFDKKLIWHRGLVPIAIFNPVKE